MQITDQLIQKFLADRCTDAEASAVARYLKENPSLLAVYLRPTWEESPKKGILPYGYREQMLTEIERQIKLDKRVVLRKMFVRFAVAASVVFIAAMGWLYHATYYSQPEKKRVTASHSASDWKTDVNQTDDRLRLILPDGSVIHLLPGSSVKYKKSFGVLSREIYLKGPADFNVAKNKDKPFVVHSRLFTTTVLGTYFMIDENEWGGSIKLYSGSIMVHQAARRHSPLYMQPGEKLNYDAVSGNMDVAVFKKKTMPLLYRKKPDTAMRNDAKLVFDNTPLPDVMNALQKRYNSQIQYNKDHLSGMYFTGEVLKDDSLFVLLKVITQMNSLLVTEKQDGFIISNIK